MTRLATVVAVWSVLGAACAVAPSEPSRPANAEPALSRVGVMQQMRGQLSTFVTCTDCPRPTPKTVATLEQAAASIQVVRPVASFRAQPTAPPAVDIVLPFENASAQIGPQAHTRLAALKPMLLHARKVRVVGYTDNQGAVAPNAKLADQRALQVLLHLRQALPTEGVEISATGRPLCCYVASNQGAAGRAPNRRVELHIEFEPTEAALMAVREFNSSALAAASKPGRVIAGADSPLGDIAARYHLSANAAQELP